MADFNFTLKRGAGGSDTLYPATTWTQVLNKPSTFTPTSHTHSGSDITSGTISASYLPSNTLIGSSSSGAWSLTQGALPVYSTAVGWFTLGAGTNGQVLKIVSGSPAWASDTDTDTNNYLTGVSGSGNGTTTFTRLGLSDLTFNSSHSHGNISSTGTMGGSSISPGSGVNILVSGSDNTIGKSSISFLGGGTEFLRRDGTWAAVSGSGDVVGPSSSVDNRVVLFNGSSGKLIKDSGVLISGLATSTHNHGVIGVGDMIYSTDGSTLTRLGTGGAANRVLRTNSSALPEWSSQGVVIYSSTLATNTSSTTITASPYRRLHIYGAMSGFTTLRTMFSIDYADIANSTTRIYRYVWNNGSGTFSDNLTITKNSSGNFTFQHSSGNSPWTIRIIGYIL